jgi:formate dehydrogenase iron-sulfur subunit
MMLRTELDNGTTSRRTVGCDRALGRSGESTRDGRVVDGGELLARLLGEQQQLTAVEEFSTVHSNGIPDQAKCYAKLLPASPPGPGEQYAFEVDLDRCSGCKACVTACHTLNGLDEEETWRDVGLLIGGTSIRPVMQHVTTACHHCLDPGCMTACPVDAYEKDPVTGIVKHLDDQCFGCQYCTLACPYNVPKYHSGKGIVRKCDMCSDRLAEGEAPACVAACPHEAISIRTVAVEQVREDAEADPFLPAAPEPSLTLPTTNYKTKRVFPRNLLPADYHSVSPQHPHWPLIVMLVLTQLSVGAFVMGQVIESTWGQLANGGELPDDAIGGLGGVAAFRPLHATSALAFGLLALAASLFHLGRPQYAFRAMIGLKHSWLSREILAFGLFAGCAVLYAGSCWLGHAVPADAAGGLDALPAVLGWAVAAFGIAGVFCSVMIYVFTKREFWSFPRTATTFGLSSALLGIAATALSILCLSLFVDAETGMHLTTVIGPTLARVLLLAAGIKLVYELALFRHLLANRQTSLKRSARLMLGMLSNVTLARFALGILGGIVMPLMLLFRIEAEGAVGGDPSLVIIATMLFAACLAGELLERYLFFAAVSAPRMPGSLRP